MNKNLILTGIDLKTLYAMAEDRDWYGNPIIKKHGNKVTIYTHDMPSYYGDGYEPTEDDFYSLFATYDKKEMKIIDTYILDDMYKGMRILTKEEIETADSIGLFYNIGNGQRYVYYLTKEIYSMIKDSIKEWLGFYKPNGYLTEMIQADLDACCIRDITLAYINLKFI